MTNTLDPKKLLKENIKWNRKWMDEPNYLHSYRVYNLLKEEITDADVLIAWILHDIVEDSDITFDDLKRLWYTTRTIELIRNCTHDDSIGESIIKRSEMIQRAMKDRDSFLIKMADATDNIKTIHHMSKPSFKRYMEVKSKFFKAAGAVAFPDTKIYRIFLERYDMQKERYDELFA